jgi:hypothetical protein
MPKSRTTLSLLFALILTALLAVPALAASPHFITGPDYTIANNTVTATGKIAGLGNRDVTAVLDVTFSTQCRNPGENVAPGQNASSSTTLTGLHPENGNLVFSISTTPVVTNESAGCPNPQWQAEIVGPITAVLSFYQGGKLVLQDTHTF